MIARQFALAVLLAAPASALPSKTESYLKEVGIDPAAAGVVAVASDSVTAASGEVYTLDSLAAKRDETGVKSFLVTRGFLYDFRNDPEAQFPDDEYYNILFLSLEERKHIAKTLMTGLTQAPAAPRPAVDLPTAEERTKYEKLFATDKAEAESYRVTRDHVRKAKAVVDSDGKGARDFPAKPKGFASRHLSADGKDKDTINAAVRLSISALAE